MAQTSFGENAQSPLRLLPWGSGLYQHHSFTLQIRCAATMGSPPSGDGMFTSGPTTRTSGPASIDEPVEASVSRPPLAEASVLRVPPAEASVVRPPVPAAAAEPPIPPAPPVVVELPPAPLPMLILAP